uniref:IMPDH domain-containing protein n=1 Tax=Brugia pahangi TaxID=6280 RepID=A0A0N4T677_BRUPA
MPQADALPTEPQPFGLFREPLLAVYLHTNLVLIIREDLLEESEQSRTSRTQYLQADALPSELRRPKQSNFIIEKSFGIPVIDQCKLVRVLINRDIRVAAAIGTGKKDGIERCETMVREEIDVINVDAGVDAMKIRTEPRSTCTTKVVGVGVPQFSAIQNVAKTCKARKVRLTIKF